MLIARIKSIVYIDGGYKIDEDLLERIFISAGGHELGLADWTALVRTELRLSTSDISDDQVACFFDALDAEGNGFIDRDEVTRIAKAVDPKTKPKLAGLLEEVARFEAVCAAAGQEACGQSAKLSPSPSAKSPSSPACIKDIVMPPKTRIRVKDIQDDEINGMEGVVVGFEEGSQRYKVRLDDGKKIQFSPGNLMPAPDPNSPFMPRRLIGQTKVQAEMGNSPQRPAPKTARTLF
jgi:hypothetical protein